MRLRYCWIFLLLLLFGCSTVNPPADYYHKVQEMEKHGGGKIEQSSEKATPPSEDSSTVEVVRKPPEQEWVAVSETPLPQAEEAPAVEKEEVPGSEELLEKRVVDPESILPSEPIAVAPAVIKRALENSKKVTVRNVELVNGRLSAGKNSIRINFVCDSANSVNDKYALICAVIYHLDKETKTVDVIVGTAEDDKTNIMAVLQSNMKDITAWMTNKVSRAEWLSNKVTKKTL